MPATDEDITRDLLRRYTSQVNPPASIAAGVIARQRHTDRRRRAVFALAATGAAAGVAAGVVTALPGRPARPGTGPAAATTTPPVRLTADQRVLYHLSTVAGRQQRSQGRYAVMRTAGTGVRDTTVLDSRTGNMWSYQKGTGGYPSGSGFTRHYSPTAAQFAAMPTRPAALRAALIALWDEQNRPASSPPRATGPVVVPRPIHITSDDKVFQQASYLLWNPLVGPVLRSALFRVLATVPGVRVNPAARDSLGRPAVEISRMDRSGLPGGRSDRQVYATYESPATGAVLESTITYPPGSDLVTPQDPGGTRTVIDRTIYLGITWTRSVPASPYQG